MEDGMTLFSSKLWTIGGGKGGVGKSFITACMAVVLARTGKSVIAVDSSLGSPSLHTFLGVRAPGRTLVEALDSGAPAASALAATAEPGLQLLTFTGDGAGGAELPEARRRAILDALAALSADHILLDLGSGSATAFLDFFNAGERMWVVSTPDAASIHCTYSFLRNAHRRRPESRQAWSPSLILNMAGTEQDQRTPAILQAAVRQSLGLSLALAGVVSLEAAVLHAAQRMTTLDFGDPSAPAVCQVRQLVESALSGESPLEASGGPDAPPLAERSPVPGLNDNLEFLGRRLHVQTEDMGARRGLISTHVFLNGKVIHSIKSQYPHADDRANIAGIMRSQHLAIMRQIESQRERSLYSDCPAS